MTNILNVITPYQYHNTWVFDDESLGLKKEPLVKGFPEIIDYLAKNIPNSSSGFRLFFSSRPFPNYHLEIIRLQEKLGRHWYKMKEELVPNIDIKTEKSQSSVEIAQTTKGITWKIKAYADGGDIEQVKNEATKIFEEFRKKYKNE